MTFKTLLVHAQASAKPRLETAVALAKAFDARLIGVGAEMYQPLAFADPYGFAQGEWLTLMREQLERNLAEAETAFEAAAAGMDHEWRRLVDLPTPAIAACSRAADLIVVGGSAQPAGDSFRATDLGELIVTAGRPVLVAPPSGGRLIGKTVILAWKDTREARRAARDALPLLTRANDVIVVSVVPEHRVEAAVLQTGDVAAWLIRHGVKARTKVVAGYEDEAGPELQLQAASAHADLIVAGGYGHNRFTEWLLGGVTRTLLEHPQQFGFFSH